MTQRLDRVGERRDRIGECLDRFTERHQALAESVESLRLTAEASVNEHERRFDDIQGGRQ